MLRTSLALVVAGALACGLVLRAPNRDGPTVPTRSSRWALRGPAGTTCGSPAPVAPTCRWSTSCTRPWSRCSGCGWDTAFGTVIYVTALYAPAAGQRDGLRATRRRFRRRKLNCGHPAARRLSRFDSYRLTYRYSFVRTPSFNIAAGATAKIRDAEISLNGVETSSKTNTGFVPLLNVHIEWRPGAGPVGLFFDADALAAPQGRAEDVLLAAMWTLHEGLYLYAGYRTLEGGADNEEVYNFAWFHYAVAGVHLRL